MELLERHHLRILYEVEKHGSLTKAAKSLGLTQPALSHAIKNLEEASGVEVWRREGRGIKRTQAGDSLLALAERVLPQFERAEERLAEMADGDRGSLRIGMECHPCYRWLLNVVSPYLKRYPRVDLDVKQRFQFGGVGALFSHDIDLLVTPDPLQRKGLIYTPVFNYEQRLVVAKDHHLASKRQVTPADLSEEVLLTYPVDEARLDIYSQFLSPAGATPKKRKSIETTDIMLQMVASGRGVTALPGWLAKEYSKRLGLRSLRLGKGGIKKLIHLGVREPDASLSHLQSFIKMAKATKI